MTFRNFDEDAPEIAKEGPVFQLGGEEFHCIPAAPGGAMLRLVKAVGRDERNRQVYNLPDIDAFIREVLIEEREVPAVAVDRPERERVEGEDDAELVQRDEAAVMVTEPADDIQRWDALLNDKKRPMHISQLGELLMWLQSEYTTRPTKRSER